MALIKCSECGREISDKAAYCIGCGCPMPEVLKGIEEANKQKDNPPAPLQDDMGSTKDNPEGLRRCPTCLDLVSSGAEVCSSCGYSFVKEEKGILQ